MIVERFPPYDGLSTVVCTAAMEDMSAIRDTAGLGCSISWFVGAQSNIERVSLCEPLAAVVAMSPCLVHVFGRGAERLHDELDLALQHANQFALTVWSERYTPCEAIFDIFRVDFPPDEAVDRWLSRLIIFDPLVPVAERKALLEGIRDPDRAIASYLTQE